MLAQRNNGRALVNVALVLVVLAAAGVVVYRSLRETARVKAVNRDTAVDAVTGTVLVTADGGFKEVKSEAPGKVKLAQAINKNSKFKAGDPLVQLDTTDLDRQIEELQRNYDLTKKRTELLLKDDPREAVAEEQLKTAERLHALGRLTNEQLKTAQRALDAIRKDLSVAKFDRDKLDADHEARMKDLAILRDKMTVPAPPMDGVVQAPQTWEGALIGGGQPVAIVYSNARIVAAKISEEKFGSVKVGQQANLRLLTYGSREFKAKVSKLLPTADETQRFEVWLEVEADPEILLPNSTGEVTITVDERPNALVIPRRALINNDTVYVVGNGVVRRRTVKVGYVALNVAEIREGLREGEHVIVDRLDEFRDGQRVNIQVVP